MLTAGAPLIAGLVYCEGQHGGGVGGLAGSLFRSSAWNSVAGAPRPVGAFH